MADEDDKKRDDEDPTLGEEEAGKQPEPDASDRDLFSSGDQGGGQGGDEDEIYDEDDIYDEEDPGYESRYEAASLIPEPPSIDPSAPEEPLPDMLLSDEPLRSSDEPTFDDAPERRRRFAFSDDEFEEGEAEQLHGIQPKTLVIIGGVVVSVIFVVLLGYLYMSGGQQTPEGEVMLVEAPEGPAKVEPEDRGGLEVPDQDKEVFDRISGDEANGEEKLGERPEEPQALPDGPEEGSAIEDDVAVPGDPAPHPATEAEPPAAAAPAPILPTATSGTFLVQLGAFGSERAAETGWDTMANRHRAALTGLSRDIQRADLGARGIFYRLRAGPFDTRGEADGTCRALKAAGQDCLVVTR